MATLSGDGWTLGPLCARTAQYFALSDFILVVQICTEGQIITSVGTRPPDSRLSLYNDVDPDIRRAPFSVEHNLPSRFYYKSLSLYKSFSYT
jgi:hypothetical protein